MPFSIFNDENTLFALWYFFLFKTRRIELSEAKCILNEILLEALHEIWEISVNSKSLSTQHNYKADYGPR